MPTSGRTVGHSNSNDGSRIVVAGLGLLTPLGHSPWQTFRALLAGRTLTDRADRLPRNCKAIDVARRVGAVSVVQHSLCDPTVELAERAARQALRESGLDTDNMPVILASSKGAVGSLIRAAGRYGPAAGNTKFSRETGTAFLRADPESVALGPHEYLARQLCRRLDRPQPVRHVVAACASGLVAVDLARRMLMAPGSAARPQSVLVVAADSALTPLFVHSYRRLGVLAPLTASAYRGRPLAVDRCGFVLAETGAAVVLRRAEDVDCGCVELVDSAVACEPHDLIRPASRMKSLDRVAQRLLNDRAIDLLHPHAPGTAAHDPAEISVFSRYAQRLGDIYACKGAVGHGLGAAGLVSLVLACLCARSGKRPAMPWLDQPIAAVLPMIGASRDARAPLRHHAIFASGFGGHVAGALLAVR